MITAFFFIASFAIAIAPPDPTAGQVLRSLDLTSFANSTGPSRAPGRKVPADWGFIDARESDGLATLTSRVNPWSIGLRLIRREGPEFIGCFTDLARNGGSYRVQIPVRIKAAEGGGYKVTESGFDEKRCPVVGT